MGDDVERRDGTDSGACGKSKVSGKRYSHAQTRETPRADRNVAQVDLVGGPAMPVTEAIKRGQQCSGVLHLGLEGLLGDEIGSAGDGDGPVSTRCFDGNGFVTHHFVRGTRILPEQPLEYRR